MEWLKYEIRMKRMEKNLKYCKNKEIIKGIKNGEKLEILQKIER